jgi:microcompartment protein CcmL/EutN
MEIHLDNYYTKDQVYTKSEVDSAILVINQNLLADIASAQQNAITTAEQYTDDRLDSDILPRVDQNTNDIATLKNQQKDYVKKTFTPALVNNASITTDESKGTLTLAKSYLDGTTASQDVNIPIVSDDVCGLSNPSDHKQIAQNARDIESISNLGVYIGKSFATVSEMLSAPIESTWTVNDFTYVQDDENHDDSTTLYILIDNGGSLAWSFGRIINYDPPANFSEVDPGLILGSNVNGQVKSNADGTGTVNGFDDLSDKVDTNTTDITDLGNDKADKVAQVGGTYTKVTVNDQGVVSSGSDIAVSDIPGGVSGQVLKTNSAGKAAWGSLSVSGIAGGSVGQVLKTNSAGNAEWGAVPVKTVEGVDIKGPGNAQVMQAGTNITINRDTTPPTIAASGGSEGAPIKFTHGTQTSMPSDENTYKTASKLLVWANDTDNTITFEFFDKATGGFWQYKWNLA